jgi:putative DNA methylase
MIPKECKRLAEVDFPIAVVSKHSAREKSIRHGHPSTLHLWWARRPLGACRAILLCLLLPDPVDPNCPIEFKEKARNILARVQGFSGREDKELQKELLRFIGDFSSWENSARSAYVDAARSLVRAAYGKEHPLVVDPFAGGGSIPFEALRLGCDGFASDLNPVACAILATMLEQVPRSGSSLSDEIRTVGLEIKRAAEREMKEFYASEVRGKKPIAYLWARTINCDNCACEIPLLRSFWLGSKAARKRAIRYSVLREKGKAPELSLEVFEPRKDSDVPKGTITRAKASCPACNVTMPPERVKMQLRGQNGGANAVFDDQGARLSGARLLVVVTLDAETSGRNYRVAQEVDYVAVRKAALSLSELDSSLLPNDPLPPWGTLGFRVQPYGMVTWDSLFTFRQSRLLICLQKFTKEFTREKPSLALPLALVIDKFADKNTSLCRWKTTAEYMAGNTFSRPALPFVWDFCEAHPFGGASGGWEEELEWVCKAVEYISNAASHPAQVERLDARKDALPPESATVWFTDPPYYDAIPYSDLSGFFQSVLSRSLPSDLASRLFKGGVETESTTEIVQDESKLYMGVPKDRTFFELRMGEAFAAGRRVLDESGIACVVFAHKTTEGWEALLSGMITGGWTITGSWPLSTEMSSRLRARESAALATSVHLVCRPRPEDAPIGDWADILREVPNRVGEWIEKLQSEGIRGADLVFACIGPAMEIYSRYRRVEDAEGREIPLGGDPEASEPYRRGFLPYVWETVGRMALEQVLGTAEAKARNGAAGALEEDARLTALFLWTIQSTDTNSEDPSEDAALIDDDDESTLTKSKSGYSLIYDVAKRFAQPLGIHLDKWEGRIIETEKGVVRLLPVGERAMQLFGDADASAISRRIEQDVKASRNYAFAFMQDVVAAPQINSRGRRKAGAAAATVEEPAAVQTVTTLDRVHAAMLLQASGQANGLRAMLKEEQQRGPDFLRLANALSALYPKDSEEKRLLDAMLLAVPR